MSADETTRLRALLKGIALPWKAQPTVVDGDEVECLALVLCPHGDDGDRDMVAEIDMGHGVECDDAHAALIVAAVNALPGLLDRVERAERERAEATANVRQLRADVELATAQRDAETCRADNAEAERDDLAATLETRTAEHALAMEQLAAVTAERDVALGQQAPLLDAHDALVAAARAAGWMGAGATGEELVAWVRRGGACEGAVAVRDAVMGYLDEIFPGGPAATDARWPHELMEHVACAVARVKRSVGGAT